MSTGVNVIDQAIATRVMGWEQHPDMEDCWATGTKRADGTVPYRQKHYFSPSTHLQHTHEAGEAVRSHGVLVRRFDSQWILISNCPPMWSCEIMVQKTVLGEGSRSPILSYETVSHWGIGPTRELAECRAMLKWAGMSEKDIEALGEGGQ